MKNLMSFQEFNPAETSQWNLLRGLVRWLVVAALLAAPAVIWLVGSVLGRVPAVAALVVIFSVSYLPLVLRRRAPALRVDSEGNVEVRTLGAGVNSRLLRASLVNLVSFVISAVMLIAVMGDHI